MLHFALAVCAAVGAGWGVHQERQRQAASRLAPHPLLEAETSNANFTADVAAADHRPCEDLDLAVPIEVPLATLLGGGTMRVSFQSRAHLGGEKFELQHDWEQVVIPPGARPDSCVAVLPQRGHQDCHTGRRGDVTIVVKATALRWEGPRSSVRVEDETVHYTRTTSFLDIFPINVDRVFTPEEIGGIEITILDLYRRMYLESCGLLHHTAAAAAAAAAAAEDGGAAVGQSSTGFWQGVQAAPEQRRGRVKLHFQLEAPSFTKELPGYEHKPVLKWWNTLLGELVHYKDLAARTSVELPAEYRHQLYKLLSLVDRGSEEAQHIREALAKAHPARRSTLTRYYSAF